MATITVTNNADRGDGSLRSAIQTAQSGDTIKFSSSLANQTITLENFIGIDKSLTIDGSDAPGLTISGGEQTSIFRLAQENRNLTVQNLTLADSYHQAGVGGAIWATENSNLNLNNVEVINNVSQGAAIHGQEGTDIKVTNSTFENNDGTLNGNSTKSHSAGGISLFGFGSLNVNNSKFYNNKGYSGSAIRTTISDVTITGSEFVGNDSTSGANKPFVDVPGGGAIYVDVASVPVDDRFAAPNRVDSGDGEGGDIIIRNTLVDGNRTAGEGAITIYGANQDRVIIEDSTITNNTVVENIQGNARGGGIRASGFIEINNSTISNNQAKNGGGLWWQGEVPAKISNSTFANNQAVNGGAIYDGLWSAEIDIINTDFDSNSATNEGGAFYSQNNRPVSFQNSQFTNNTPDKINDIDLDSNFPDISSGSESNNNILGTEQNSYLVGLNGDDILTGNGGDDYLDGGANEDNLIGGEGNDTLIGGNSRNDLDGGEGNDIFIGGNGQDVIQGGGGQDTYVIGDADNVFYNNQPWYDHAIITDFQPGQDTIQLKGQASNYRVDYASNGGRSGTGIFSSNGMITLIENISPDDFSLNANYINYINGNNSATNNSPMALTQDSSEDNSVELTQNSSDNNLIELTQNSSFFGQPGYAPAEHNGLIIWNNNNTWHIEATGDLDGSNFTGQIIIDGTIQNLDTNSLENSDRVGFVDNSNQILEFDLKVIERGKDTISFEVTDETSLSLDLGDNDDVTVKAGASLEEISV